MTGKGHTLSALYCSPSVGAYCYYAGFEYLQIVCILFGLLIGSTAPDWLEIPYQTKVRKTRSEKIVVTKRLLKHRGVTHVLAIWVVLFFVCLHLYKIENIKDTVDVFYITGLGFNIGFSLGCIIHWLGDVPNERKVPILSTFDGIALNLCLSGRYEKTCGLMITAIITWFMFVLDDLYADYSTSIVDVITNLSRNVVT